MAGPKRYKLPAEIIGQYDAETRQQTRLVGIGLVIGGGLVMLVIALIGLFPWTTLVFTIPGWLLFVALGMFFHGQTQRDTWSSYTIEITDEQVRQLRAGRKTTVIQRDEISEVEDIDEAGLLIKTERALRVILVPDAIEGYDEIRTTIIDWLTTLGQ